jgi:hypothetical protein
MTEYAHAHPMSEGRRFEHTHDIHPYHLAYHPETPLEDAHPDLADVAHAPAPGSPADLRRQAAECIRQSAYHQERAAYYVRRAHELEAQADRDERHPPNASERLHRILDRGET